MMISAVVIYQSVRCSHCELHERHYMIIHFFTVLTAIGVGPYLYSMFELTKQHRVANPTALWLPSPDLQPDVQNL